MPWFTKLKNKEIKLKCLAREEEFLNKTFESKQTRRILKKYDFFVFSEYRSLGHFRAIIPPYYGWNDKLKDLENPMQISFMMLYESYDKDMYYDKFFKLLDEKFENTIVIICHNNQTNLKKNLFKNGFRFVLRKNNKKYYKKE